MIYTNSLGDRTGSPCKGPLGPLARLDDYCHAAPRHLGRRRFLLSQRCQLRTATGPLIDRAPVMGTAILNAEPVSRV